MSKFCMQWVVISYLYKLVKFNSICYALCVIIYNHWYISTMQLLFSLFMFPIYSLERTYWLILCTFWLAILIQLYSMMFIFVWNLLMQWCLYDMHKVNFIHLVIPKSKNCNSIIIILFYFYFYFFLLNLDQRLKMFYFFYLIFTNLI